MNTSALYRPMMTLYRETINIQPYRNQSITTYIGLKSIVMMLLNVVKNFILYLFVFTLLTFLLSLF